MTTMTDQQLQQQLQQQLKDLCEDGLWTIFETKEAKVPERTHKGWILTENGKKIAGLLK
jgi:DNA-binding HxlR family transcriptional regulator